jgi:hypothetical protein
MSETERETIKRLAKEGKVELSSEDEAALNRMTKPGIIYKVSSEPDFTLRKVQLTGATELEDGGYAFDLAWQTESAGFGHICFWSKDSLLHCDNEAMGRDFLKKVVCKLVDDATLSDG